MNTSGTLQEFALALATAQREYKPIRKTETARGKAYSYNYAPLDAVLDAIRPALTGQGISILQAVEAEGQRVSVTTRLLHSSGEWVESMLSMTAASESEQDLGKCATYARRYALLGLAGAHPEEEDDDAPRAARPAHDTSPASSERAAGAMRAAVRDPVKRKVEALSWFGRGPMPVREAIAKVLGRTFPGEGEIMVTMTDLEKLESWIIAAEAEKQAAHGS